MKSIKEIYKTGKGPSSSHTMGPEIACTIFKNEQSEATSFKAVLYGSLAKTGKGHRTDGVIEETLYPVKCEVVFDTETKEIPHENTMDLFAYKNGEQIGYMRILSVGGGDIVI